MPGATRKPAVLPRNGRSSVTPIARGRSRQIVPSGKGAGVAVSVSRGAASARRRTTATAPGPAARRPDRTGRPRGEPSASRGPAACPPTRRTPPRPDAVVRSADRRTGRRLRKVEHARPGTTEEGRRRRSQPQVLGGIVRGLPPVHAFPHDDKRWRRSRITGFVPRTLAQWRRCRYRRIRDDAAGRMVLGRCHRCARCSDSLLLECALCGLGRSRWRTVSSDSRNCIVVARNRPLRDWRLRDHRSGGRSIMAHGTRDPAEPTCYRRRSLKRAACHRTALRCSACGCRGRQAGPTGKVPPPPGRGPD